MIDPGWTRERVDRLWLYVNSLSQQVDELTDKPQDEQVDNLVSAVDLILNQAGELRRALPHSFRPKDD